MFKLDEKFLEMMGLSAMPEGEKAAFLDYLQEEVEVKVGDKLSEGLTDAQMEEFEKLVDGDKGVVDKVLAESGDYKNDEVYKMMVGQNGFADGTPETLNEYASMKWMMKNRPDYKEIVNGVMEELKKEVEANKEELLGKLTPKAATA